MDKDINRIKVVLTLPQKEIYKRLKTSGILYDYIVPSYDMIEEGIGDLHCRSDKYLAGEVWREYQESKIETGGD